MEPALAIDGICKRFGITQALDRVGFSVDTGEVCAIVGENGAGKSTLMNILAGAIVPDRGRVSIHGRDVSFRTPHDAQRHGIGIVHQELSLIETLTVLENLFIGRLPAWRGLVNWPAMRAEARSILAKVGAEGLNVDAKAAQLSIGQRQLVEIARVLSTDPAILILDEPTSSLSERDSERLLALIRNLRRDGHTILYISHRMHEVIAIADTVVVLRDGRFIWKRPRTEIDEDTIGEAMVGREVQRVHRDARALQGRSAIELRNVSTEHGLQDISLALYPGEIVGLAGLIGAGRTEVALAMFGASRVTSGEILVNGEAVRLRSPRDALARGISLIPEDRKTEGLNLVTSIAENAMIAYRHVVSRSELLNWRVEKALVSHFVAKLGIHAPSGKTSVSRLSGGNQQKVVVAKGLAINPRVIIFDEPTRGVDISAKAEIHKLIIGAAEAGAAVLLISSELPELLAIADRIVVMANRRVKTNLPKSASEADVIMHALAN